MSEHASNEEQELAKLPLVRMHDVLLSRIVAREEAARLGFGSSALTQISTAVSEMARNVVQHSGGAGQMRVFRVTRQGQQGLKIEVTDTGKGIADLSRALNGTSAGAGIPGTKRLVDEFAIQSTLGAGTEVSMMKWLSA